jgi:ribosomal protein S18 acetylase RimI-like enzyme
MRRDSVQTDLDYFLWSLREEPQVLAPHVLAVQRDGMVETIVAARLSQARLPCKVGYRTVYAPAVRAISVVRDGLLGRSDPETAAAVVHELLSGLERREADVVLFRQLECDTALHQAALARSTFATREHVSHSDRRWLIELPPTLDEYLGSLTSSTRKNVRRTACRVEKEFGDRLTLRIFREPDELDVFLAAAEAVAGRTYQRGLGVGFLGTPGQRARTKMLMEHGWFRGYVLYVEGRPVAFEQGELYAGRFVSLSAGYDPDYRRHRIGAYLLAKAIEELTADPGASVFDFGFGDADYKSRLAHRCTEEGDVLIYARRPRPIWINFLRTGLLGAGRLARSGLRRVALLDAVKQGWRRRATDAQSVQGKSRSGD